MADPSKIVQATATGDIATGTAYLRSVILTAGNDDATVTVRAGGSNGTVVLTLAAAQATSVSTGMIKDALCSGGIHVTLSGTGPSVTVVYA